MIGKDIFQMYLYVTSEFKSTIQRGTYLLINIIQIFFIHKVHKVVRKGRKEIYSLALFAYFFLAFFAVIFFFANHHLFNKQHKSLQIFPFRVKSAYRMIGRLRKLMNDLYIPAR